MVRIPILMPRCVAVQRLCPTYLTNMLYCIPTLQSQWHRAPTSPPKRHCIDPTYRAPSAYSPEDPDLPSHPARHAGGTVLLHGRASRASLAAEACQLCGSQAHYPCTMITAYMHTAQSTSKSFQTCRSAPPKFSMRRCLLPASETRPDDDMGVL